MKKLFMTIVVTTTIFGAFAQDTTQTKKHNNEFGVDALSFFKQFVKLTTYYYEPTENYYLTYRRHFKNSNIRFAIGGDLESSDRTSPYQGDSNKYHNTSYSINSRLGYEFYNDLSKRWQAFYGVDLKQSLSYSKGNGNYWNGGLRKRFREKITDLWRCTIVRFSFQN